MEKRERKEDGVYINSRRYKKDLSKLFPKEVCSNSMTTIKNTYKILWRPNNYRRQIKVKLKNNSTIKKIKGAISTTSKLTFSYNPHTGMVSVKNYAQNEKNKGITIQYGKDTLTGIYSQNIIGGVKEIFLIEADSIENLQKRIDMKKEEIKQYIDMALYQFIEQFKLKIPFVKPKWSRYEDFIKGEDYIDKIPREVIIHDTYFKKVYGEGIEFKNSGNNEDPTVFMKNYIKNRAIEDISPQIAEELMATRETVKGVLKINESSSKVMNQFIRGYTEQSIIFDDLAKNIKTHNKVIKEMAKAVKEFNKKLTQKKLGDYL